MVKSKRKPQIRPKRHGAYSFIVRGSLPTHRAYLLRYLTDCRQGLINDLGGCERLSTGQTILIDRVIGKLGVSRLIEEHCKENGAIRGQELAPVLKQSYLAYSNSLRLDLLALGINERVTDRALTPLQYIEQFDKSKEEREKRAGKRASK